MIRLLIVIPVLAALAGCESLPRQVLPYVMDDPQTGTLDLHLYDLESGISRALIQTRGCDEYDPCVDPLGSKVVYITKKPNEDPDDVLYTLTVYELETGIDREYASSTNRMSSPVWSNNGEKIAYVVERDGKFQINVRDLASNSPARAIGFGSAPSWRQDGQAIFYSSKDTLDAPVGELMVHDLRNGLNQSLALRGNGFSNLARGTSIVYTTLPYTRRNEAIWMIDATSRQKRLSSPGKTYRDTNPVHINGTKFVAFTRTEVATGASSLFVVERYATDPVETLLFEAKANAFTSGATLITLPGK
ncbi:MAG: hypothetical protein AAGI37_18015 [Planctomycetota bacterium]